MGDTLESAGSVDGMLIHVNPNSPQLTVAPAVTAIEQQHAPGYSFSAMEGETSVDADWTLLLDGVFKGAQSASSTYSLPTNMRLGRYELTVDDGTTFRRHYFDVTPNAPSDLQVYVPRKGGVTLTWTDNQHEPNESGFYVEYATPITFGWTLQETLPADAEAAGPYTVIRSHTKHEIRVRTFMVWEDLSGRTLTLVSPFTEFVEMNPEVPGTYDATPVSSFPSVGEIAAAVDAALADEELLKKKSV
jgi:hypothetical protein